MGFNMISSSILLICFTKSSTCVMFVCTLRNMSGRLYCSGSSLNSTMPSFWLMLANISPDLICKREGERVVAGFDSISSHLPTHHVQDVALRFDGTGQLHTAGHIAQRERQEGFRQALYITFIQGCRNLAKERVQAGDSMVMVKLFLLTCLASPMLLSRINASLYLRIRMRSSSLDELPYTLTRSW